MEHRLGGGKSRSQERSCGLSRARIRPDAPRAFADPLASPAEFAQSSHQLSQLRPRVCGSPDWMIFAPWPPSRRRLRLTVVGQSPLLVRKLESTGGWDCPHPIAGRSLRASLPSAHSMPAPGYRQPRPINVVEVPEAAPSRRLAARRSLAQRAIRVAPPRRQSAQTGPPCRAGRMPSAARMAALGR